MTAWRQPVGLAVVLHATVEGSKRSIPCPPPMYRNPEASSDNGAEVVAREAICRRVTDERWPRRARSVHADQSALRGREPQASGAIHVHIEHRARRHAFAGGEERERPVGVADEPAVEARSRSAPADPQRTIVGRSSMERRDSWRTREVEQAAGVALPPEKPFTDAKIAEIQTSPLESSKSRKICT